MLSGGSDSGPRGVSVAVVDTGRHVYTCVIFIICIYTHVHVNVVLSIFNTCNCTIRIRILICTDLQPIL